MARLYRAFISEAVAVLDGNPDCDEVNIVGDAVWAVIDTPTKDKVSSVVGTLASLSSMLDVLNLKLTAAGYNALAAGIGVEWGRALVVKAGFSGSGINEIVYMGDVVNAAAKLAAKGQLMSTTPRIMGGRGFVENISRQDWKNFFTWNAAHGCYTASLINPAMDQWRRANGGY